MSAFRGGFHGFLRGGWWGRLSSIARYLPAALGNRIFTLDKPRVAKAGSALPPITDPLGSSNRTATAGASFSVRAPKRQGAFSK